jgi:aryl-alcohol dehydrogenase-like predicted oxidoreductase
VQKHCGLLIEGIGDPYGNRELDSVVAMLRRAGELGITLFDMAPRYWPGEGID